MLTSKTRQTPDEKIWAPKEFKANRGRLTVAQIQLSVDLRQYEATQ